jgi:hypothetical protein
VSECRVPGAGLELPGAGHWEHPICDLCFKKLICDLGS